MSLQEEKILTELKVIASLNEINQEERLERLEKRLQDYVECQVNKAVADVKCDIAWHARAVGGVAFIMVLITMLVHFN
ncbi:hypothetical protein [Halodesulfovibrio aestuarii]|uniref:hypothetical protein n=1 Tax=Halodesulfovibrio aestuarii TaxID=126333 RepID=UPI0004011A6E